MSLGINGSTIKAHNEALLIGLIRRNKLISRRELAELSGLTPATVSSIIARLIQDRIVEEGETAPSRGGSKGGRRRTYVYLIPGSRLAGGLLIHRNGLEGTIIDIQGTIYVQHSRQYSQFLGSISESEIMNELADMADSLQKETRVNAKWLGWGIGVPWWYPSNVSWPGLIDKIKAKGVFRGSSVYLTQNAVCGAVAEWWYDEHSLKLPSLYIFIGGGIGGCLVRPGERHDTPSFHPIELGHMGINPDGPACYCGANGCLEQFAGPSVISADKKNDAARYLAYALRSITLLFDLQEIIVASSDSQLLERDYLSVVRQILKQTRPAIRVSQVAFRGEAVGAAAVVFYEDGVHVWATDLCRTNTSRGDQHGIKPKATH